MEIPLNVDVKCTDGVCGRSMFVLIDPIVDKITHLVVRMDLSPHTEYIVPVEVVSETTKEMIHLHCTKVELEKMDPFIKTAYVEEKVPEKYLSYDNGMYGMGTYFFLPYVIPEMTMQVPVEQEQIPLGELAIRRGTRVEAKDGYIGRVDEFVINPENSHITHLVMREGHLWGRKEVTIPISAIEKIEDSIEDTVFLNIDKHQIEALPTFLVKRRWN